MNPPPANGAGDRSAPETEVPYTLEVLATLAGVSSATVLHYHEEGLISPLPGSPREAPGFDDDAVRALRRIEYLQTTCEASLPALKLVLRLLEEVEVLRVALAARR
jgi:DNA-binding transcriptional MerR regulator